MWVAAGPRCWGVGLGPKPRPGPRVGHSSSSWATRRAPPAPPRRHLSGNWDAGSLRGRRAGRGCAPRGCPSLLLWVWVPPAGKVPRPQLRTGVIPRGRHVAFQRLETAPHPLPREAPPGPGRPPRHPPPKFAASEPTSGCRAGTAPSGAAPSLPAAPGLTQSPVLRLGPGDSRVTAGVASDRPLDPSVLRLSPRKTGPVTTPASPGFGEDEELVSAQPRNRHPAGGEPHSEPASARSVMKRREGRPSSSSARRVHTLHPRLAICLPAPRQRTFCLAEFHAVYALALPRISL